MSGKGGGAVGAVSFAAYIENVHKEFLGSDQSDDSAQTLNSSVVDIMNALMGTLGTFAVCTMTVIPSIDISNDEGFILTDYNGDNWVYKFDVASGGVTNEDYTIAIEADVSANVVRNATRTVIEASLKFSTQNTSTDQIIIAQNIAGENGNTNNVSMVSDVDFLVPDFANGGGNDNPYALATVYDPDDAIAAIQTKVDLYEATMSAIDQVSDWGTNVDGAISKANSTYADIDISTLVQSIVTEAVTDASTVIDSIRGGTVADVNTLMDAAIAQVSVMIASAPIQDVITEYQRNLETTHLRTISRFAGGMADINAVQSSAFLIGMAMMEAEHSQSIDQFTAQLSLDIYNNIMSQYLATHGRYVQEELSTFVDRFNKHLSSDTARFGQNEISKSTLIQNGAAEIGRLYLAKLESSNITTQHTSDLNKTKIVAKTDEIKQGNLYDVEDWLWDLKIFQYGSNVLSGVATGGQVLPESPSQLAGGLSGALAGAGIGATLGPHAAVAGAILGGIGGLIANE